MNNKGITLIELVISMTIIAIALVGTLLSINTSVATSSDPMLVQQSYAIAESYLEEILNKSFPVTPCPSGIRSNYKNICNYHGLSEQPTDQHGNVLTALQNYAVTVNVDNSGAILGDLSGANQVVRVDVSVTHSSIGTVSISGYRTNY